MTKLKRRYHAGTLAYTGRSLIGLCAVLLFGDFCVMIFESIFGPFMPLYLKQFDASNGMIALLTGSTAGLMNVLFLPNLSIWTDRTRTRWGRRIPFLAWSAPCTVAALMLVAFSPDFAAWIHPFLLSGKGVSLTVVTLAVLTISIFFWHFFNMVLLNVFNFLLRDVVPLELMPRFLAWFRLVGTVGHFAFQWFLYKYMLDYPKTLFLGVGSLFLVSFGLICWWVREGEYPPPLESPSSGKNVFRTFSGYFRECLSLPLYRNYFLTHALVLLGSVPVGAFLILFARHTLHLDMESLGKVTAWSTLASALLFLPVGSLCGRVGPFPIALAALLIGTAMRFFGYIFIKDQNTWLIYSVLIVVPTVAWGLGTLSLTMALFPADKFGQFSSGINTLGYGSLIVTGYLVGCLMDFLGNDYRTIFIVSALCHAIAIVPMLFVYRSWKIYGGPDNYVAPNAS